jgi:hypothetical protein
MTHGSSNKIRSIGMPVLKNVKLNQLLLRIENNVKFAVVVIDFYSASSVTYVRNFTDLNTGQQNAYNDLISWATANSAGTFPSAVPVPPDDFNPVTDDIILQVVNNVKTDLSFRPFEMDATTQQYSLLDTDTKSAYDTLCNWAETVDSRFL